MEIRKSQSRMKSNVSHDPNQPYLRIMSGSDRDGSRSHQWQLVHERKPVTNIQYIIERGACANFGNNSQVGNSSTVAAPSSRAFGLKSQKRISDYNINPNCYGSKHLNKPPLVVELSPQQQQQVVDLVDVIDEISDNNSSCNKVVNTRTNYDAKSKLDIVLLFDNLTKPITEGGKGLVSEVR